MRRSITTKKVAVYARITTQGGSLIENLSDQVIYYSDKIRENPGWEYVGIYADDVSGAKGIRAEFERMLADARRGVFDILLTDSIGRFARSKAVLRRALRELTELGIDVRFDEQGIGTMRDEGKLLPALESYLQSETRERSEKFKERFRRGFAEGKTRFVPLFGFDFVDHALVPNARQAAVVRRVFDEYISGVSPNAIAAGLNEAGVLKDSGGLWNGSMVVKLLANERYAGHSLLQKYHTVDPVTGETAVNRGELPMYLAENTHPAIVSQEMFDRAQRMRKIRSAVFTGNDEEATRVESGSDELRKTFERTNFGSRKIYGYDWDGRAFVPNREQAAVIRRIFDAYNDGVSPYAIADALKVERIPSMHGGAWTAAGVSRILRNVRYVGQRQLRKRILGTGETVTHVAENVHAPLIDRDVFDRAQEMHRLRREIFETDTEKRFESVNGRLRPIFGFDYGGGEFVPSESEAPIVRRVFAAYNGGAGIPTIIGELNRDGVAMAHGGRWHRKAIENMLNHEAYADIVGRDVFDAARNTRRARALKKSRNGRKDAKNGDSESHIP